MPNSLWRRSLTLLAGLALAGPAAAQVTRFTVTEDVPAFEGRAFGDVGPYRRITAKAVIALDPADPRNHVITDLALAPRNAQGRVEATADVIILRPADPARASGTLLLDVPNRGHKLAPELFDDVAQPGASRATAAADAGIGFLYGQGMTLVWVGWQGDMPSAPGLPALAAPTLAGVTGPAREAFVFDDARSPARGTLSYPIADPASVALSVRPLWSDPRQEPGTLSFRVLDDRTVEFTRDPALGAGGLYEVTYTARDPVVLGIGFAAVRDVAAFLRHDTTGANPLATEGRSLVRRAILFGVSQSGRFVRDFLYLGMNEDTEGRIVFEGMMPHVAGSRRTDVNVRFGQPGRNPRDPQDPAWHADLFPFTYDVLEDPLSGRRDGLLLRCRLSSTCPKIMQTDSEHEWWASHASLVVTDTQGNHIDLPADVRLYMLTGTTHFQPPGQTASRPFPPAALPTNPLHNGPPMRALLLDLEAWIADGVPPPSSRAPMRAHGTLVAPDRALAATIPGLPFAALHTPAALMDETVWPPRELGRYPVYAPLLDADGIAVDGLRALPVLVPRATYTGWNPRAPGYGQGVLYPLEGTMLPLPSTTAAAHAAGDPRPSIEARYGDEAGYQAALRREAARLVAERLLLPRDAPR